MTIDLISYQIDALNDLSMELFLVASQSVHEEELLLSGTSGDYYARLQNMVLIKPKDEE